VVEVNGRSGEIRTPDPLLPSKCALARPHYHRYSTEEHISRSLPVYPSRFVRSSPILANRECHDRAPMRYAPRPFLRCGCLGASEVAPVPVSRRAPIEEEISAIGLGICAVAGLRYQTKSRT